MKLPFDLGVKLFFRLLMPGFFLALGLAPILFAFLEALGLEQQQEVVFVLATFVIGWLLLAADMPIYMLLEGRRYWPQFLWNKFLNYEEKRLGKLNDRIDAFYRKCKENNLDKITERSYLEASVEKRSFPLSKEGERCAKFPTRFGNTLSAFETYADTRYGLDDVFYWPRICVNLSKELREELDNQQAMADSTVYSTFALALTGMLWAFYGLLNVIKTQISDFLYHQNILHEPLGKGIFSYIPGTWTCFLVASLSVFLAYIVYRIAVFTNEQFGNLFMAIFDTNVPKIKEIVDIDGIAKQITDLTNIQADDKDKFEIVRRYLQYFNVKLPGINRPVPFPQVKVKSLNSGGHHT